MQEDKVPLTVRERVERHRKRQRQRELQVAVAAARLANGEAPGDQAGALAAFIARVARRRDVPEDYLELLDKAVDRLSSKRRR